MRSSLSNRISSSISLSCLLLGSGYALAADPAPAAKEPGDLWEISSQMSMEGMEGMAMPGRTNRVCTSKQWDKPPVGQEGQSRCQTVDFNTAGSKTTWKVHCDGPPETTGEAEIERSGNDKFSGWMKFTMQGATMKMKLDGRKVGDCDVAEGKKEVAAMQQQAARGQQQAADAQANMCRQAASEMNLMLLTMKESPCTDPSLKQTYCNRLATTDGYLLASKGAPGYGLKEGGAYCGLNTTELKGRLCNEAFKTEALDFLGKECPEQTKVIAQRECAGRKYTSMGGSKYAGFCATYAQGMFEGGK